jgi:protein-S-isoprenylcysteine O-methyltransferase Ste14
MKTGEGEAMERFKAWAKNEYSLRQRVFTLILAGIFFLLILPYLLINSSAKIDQRLHLPTISAGAANLVIGILVMGGGIFLAFWAIETQISIGKGTPLPMMPTQKLIVKQPFTFCRNPMTLGTFFLYAGISICIGSISALAIVVIFTILLLLYVKFIEEKELKARFGEEYLAYKQNTPFILPRLRPPR